MCGIAGLVMRDAAQPADTRAAARMADVLFHRGPDAGGTWSDGPVAFGHRRLKIIDLSERGAQPMKTPDGRYVLVFNGEIYNYRALRRELEARGVHFESESDTEVLLHLYVVHGRAMLDRLNGIFAFAVWDRDQRVFFAARDHVGVKPVYYAIDRERLLFASESKALLAAGWPARPDPERIGEYLLYGSCAGEATLFEGVRRIPPGGYIELRSGQDLRVGRYFEPGADPVVRRSRDAARRLVRETLEAAVERQMVSDVPVGSMCSGGLDSSVVTALSATHNPGISTFCVKVPVAGFDESTHARLVASQCHTTHYELETSPGDAAALLPTLVWLHDGPLAHPNSIAIFQISRLARQHVTVLLSGEGSDEIFAGYSTYRRLGLMLGARRVTPRVLLRALRPLAMRQSRRALPQAISAALADDPAGVLLSLSTKTEPDALAVVIPGVRVVCEERRALAEGAWLRAASDPVRAALLYDQATHLQTLLDRQDKMCMGTSVESRVPLLDIELFRLANTIESRHKVHLREAKVVLREAARGLLPDAIRGRAKFPFALPLSTWFGRAGALNDLVAQLRDGELVRAGVVARAGLDQALASARAGRGMLADQVWYLLNLEVWWRVFIARTMQPTLTELPAWRDPIGQRPTATIH